MHRDPLSASPWTKERWFTAPRWHAISNAALGFTCLVFSVLAGKDGLPWAVCSLAAFVFALLSWRDGVRLGPDSIMVRRFLSEHTYERSKVTAVRHGPGAPVFIDVSGVGQVRMPYLEFEAHTLTVNLRHWIADYAAETNSQSES